MKKQSILFQLLFFCTLFSFLFAGCNDQAKTEEDQELKELKDKLFKQTADISELPIYADPPTSDYEDVRKGIFLFQIDSSELAKINKYRNELEPFIVQRIDSGYSWVYLAAYLQYKSAVPKIKDELLKSDQFYGWEGPDYSKIESYLMDDIQYCYQMAYIAAIEYITSEPIEKAITLTKQEYVDLKTRSEQCTEINIDSLGFNCSARWLLAKLKREY